MLHQSVIITFLILLIQHQASSGILKEDGCNDTSKEKFIIDTDAGSDDGVGILLALGIQKLTNSIEIIALTAALGNTDVDNVGRNILKILDTAQKLDIDSNANPEISQYSISKNGLVGLPLSKTAHMIPVYKGSNSSLVETPSNDEYFGKDGFGDFDYPNPPSEDMISQTHAAVALIEIIQSCPGQYNLIVLGPSTNLGLALRLQPNIIKNIKNIYLMGGSFNGDGNIKPGVEFNAFMDPESLHIILKEAKLNNITISNLPLETGHYNVNISGEWRRNVLGVIDSPAIRLLNKAENIHLNESQWLCLDALAVATAINNSIVSNTIYYDMNVETCGENGRGGLFGSIVDLDADDTVVPNLKVISGIKQTDFQDMLIQGLS